MFLYSQKFSLDLVARHLQSARRPPVLLCAHKGLGALEARYQLEFTAEIGNFKAKYYHLAER